MIDATDELRTAFLPAERASVDRLEAQARIFADHAYLDQVLNTLPDMVMVLNTQRQAIYANQALLDFAGFGTLNEVIGLRPGEILGCNHAFERETGCGTTAFCQFCGAAHAILASQHGDRAVQECHISAQADHKVPGMDLRVWTTPITLDGERFTIFTLADISDEVRRRELERVFFHDLLNTAGIVQATSELLVNVYESEPEDTGLAIEQGATMVGLIQRAADRLIREIQAQKAYTQLERNELEVDLKVVQSRSLLDDLIAGFRVHAIAEGRILMLAPDTEDVRFSSDRALLSRVIENMIKNALEAVAPGETVMVGSRRSEEGVEFWVHNPTVMPAQVKHQIFKRAFSTKGPGRGLGTYSMRLISERYLRGRVTFTSKTGEGTTFYAYYPMTLETEEDL